MITPVAQKIGQLLLSPQQFAIPRYQRDYKWGIEEATELIEDLNAGHLTGDEGLFLGTVIFENTKDGKLCIVDGQQRITTLILLLIACRERAKQLKDTDRVKAIQLKIGHSDEITGKTSNHRLIASKGIREVLAHMSDGSWGGAFPTKLHGKPVKRQVNRVRPIYDYFAKRVEDKDEKQLDAFLAAISFELKF
jgi:hypothetical protein